MKKFLLVVLSFFIIFFIIQFLIGELLINDFKASKDYDPALRWKDFYLTKKNSIDLIFLGSSHCYRTFVPEIFDKNLNINSFNMGSSQQTPITSYYILKEVLNYQKPKMVIFETYYDELFINDNTANALHNYLFIKSFSIKTELAYNSFSKKNLLYYSFFKAYKFNKNFNNLILSIFIKKKQAITATKIEGLTSYYSHKGYVETIADKNFKYTYDFKDSCKIKMNEINLKQVIYIKKLIELCQKRNISIILVCAPMDPLKIQNTSNYREIHNYIQNIAESYNLIYYDFNFIENYSNYQHSDFYDFGHLINKGAHRFSNELSYILKPYFQ